MLKYIRYTLAALCLAASVACLAFWGWSLCRQDNYFYDISTESCLAFESCYGSIGYIWLSGDGLIPHKENWVVKSRPISDERLQLAKAQNARDGRFTGGSNWGRFPTWYPALVFALAAVGILRLNRFTIRSALIATTAVALLLGMIVVL